MQNHQSQVRILFVGDMHLGVLPSHVPDHLTGTHNLTPHDLGPAAAWNRVVDTAVDMSVHAVALAGDLVDRSNDLFEAFGLLETGVRKLADAGIPVIAVAGNHDTEVLPRLADKIESLHLLGRGGTWSTRMITGDADRQVRLAGWSFPRTHVETSPLTSAPPAPDPGIVTFGLLHADLDQAGSRYAPVKSSELAQTGYQAWFLGHTHLPGEINTEGKPFYLGSVTGLHPGEAGEHGPVLVTLRESDRWTAERIPLAPLRWENLEISCTASSIDPGNLLPVLLEHITARTRQLGDSLDQVRALGFRLSLTGDTPDAGALRHALAGLESGGVPLVTQHEGTVLFIDRIENLTRLPLDLSAIARSDSPDGLLARRILVLENGSGHVPGVDDPDALRKDLITRGRQHLAEVDSQGAYLGLDEENEPVEIARLLAETGRQALEEILILKGVDHAAG